MNKCLGVIPNTFIMCGERDEDSAFWCSEECQREAYRREGAAVAFGIVGMFEAIRKNGPLLVERYYWTTERGQRLYDCHCPSCGVYMKHRRAGEDEGTDNERCGACRWY